MKYFLLTILVISAACVTGPESERKSPLNYLSGDHYQTSPTGTTNVIVVPVLKRKEKLTSISGEVSIGDGLEKTPLKFSKFTLSSHGNIVAEGTTDINGKFNIQKELDNGTYEFKAYSNAFQGQTEVRVDSYKISNVTVRAVKK